MFRFYDLKIVTIALKNREWASKKIVNAFKYIFVVSKTYTNTVKLKIHVL